MKSCAATSTISAARPRSHCLARAGRLVRHRAGEPGVSQLTSPGVTATAIYYRDLVILGETPGRLGQRGRRRAVTAPWRPRSATAFQKRVLSSRNEPYDRGSQTANAMPLVLGLVDEDRRAAVLENLFGTIRAGGNRVTAGDVGFMYVVPALSDAGRGDVLYDMVCQPTARATPTNSAKGATTLDRSLGRQSAPRRTTACSGTPRSGSTAAWAGSFPTPRSGLQAVRAQAAIGGGPDVGQGTLQLRPRTHHQPLADRRRPALWQIIVPPNTTAVVHVPAKDSALVTESGLPADQARGRAVVDAGQERGRVRGAIRQLPVLRPDQPLIVFGFCCGKRSTIGCHGHARVAMPPFPRKHAHGERGHGTRPAATSSVRGQPPLIGDERPPRRGQSERIRTGPKWGIWVCIAADCGYSERDCGGDFRPIGMKVDPLRQRRKRR